MYCSKCGNELKEDDLFCNKCGNKIISENNKNKTGNKKVEKNKCKIIIVGIAIIVIISIVLGIFFYNKQNDNKIQEIPDNVEETQLEDSYNEEDVTMNADNIENNFSNDIIKDRVENSYFRLIDYINSYNISVASKNQDRKVLALPKSGRIFALYNKQNKQIQYMQYYGGPIAGTEIIWIDVEGDAESSVLEGHYGEKVMKPDIIRAINVYGNVIDRTSENVYFLTNGAIIQTINNPDSISTEERKSFDKYILKEYKWSVDSNNTINIEEVSKKSTSIEKSISKDLVLPDINNVENLQKNVVGHNVKGTSNVTINPKTIIEDINNFKSIFSKEFSDEKIKFDLAVRYNTEKDFYFYHFIFYNYSGKPDNFIDNSYNYIKMYQNKTGNSASEYITSFNTEDSSWKETPPMVKYYKIIVKHDYSDITDKAVWINSDDISWLKESIDNFNKGRLSEY